MKNLKISHLTHPGKRRSNNEDCYIVRPDLGFYAVADGVGGSQSGEVASFVACAKFAELLSMESTPTSESLTEILKTVDDYIPTLAGTFNNKGEEGYDMCTTFTGLHFGDKTRLIHVGDSRCYFLDENNLLTQVSADHQDSWGFLTAVLGGGLCFHTYVTNLEVDPVKRWLLATDGLEELTREEIEECMQLSIEECKEELLKRTLGKGARDNVSFILLE